MFRVKYVLRLVFSAGLAVLVLGVLGIASASAASLKACLKVPATALLLGLYKEPNCTGNERQGVYAWAYPDPFNRGKSTLYCVLESHDEGLFREALCESFDATEESPFELGLGGPAFPLELGLLLKSTLVGELIGVKTEITCTDGKFHGQPTTATLAEKITITYTTCSITKPEHCEPGNPGKPAGTLETNELVGHLQSLKLVVFLPTEPGTTFIEIEYKLPAGVNCVLHGNIFKVTGTQSCDFEPAAQTPEIEHELVCKKTGSLLKLGTEKSTYEGVVHIHLEGLPYWKIW